MRKVIAPSAACRDAWVQCFLAQLQPQERETQGCNWTWAKMQVWKYMPQELRVQWQKDFSAGRPRMQRISLQQAHKWVRAGTGDSPPAKDEVPEVRSEFVSDNKLGHRGGMLTWNGRWGWDVPEVKALMEQSLSVDDTVERVRALPFYKDLWSAFTSWWKGLMKRGQWPHWTIKMEVTPSRKDKMNLVHFHAAFTDDENYHRKRDLTYWQFAGAKPKFHALNARGLRQAEKARVRLHYYCSAPKIGAV